MTPRQKQLVQKTFEIVASISEQTAALFYERLFELDPGLRPLFQGDMQAQGRKLMQMLTVAVRGLDDVGTLLPAVGALGQRHAQYGVEDEHYQTVGAALLWTLEEELGAKFTPEVKEAWTEVYGILAEAMKAAAHQKKQIAS